MRACNKSMISIKARIHTPTRATWKEAQWKEFYVKLICCNSRPPPKKKNIDQWEAQDFFYMSPDSTITKFYIENLKMAYFCIVLA